MGGVKQHCNNQYEQTECMLIFRRKIQYFCRVAKQSKHSHIQSIQTFIQDLRIARRADCGYSIIGMIFFLAKCIHLGVHQCGPRLKANSSTEATACEYFRLISVNNGIPQPRMLGGLE